MRECTFVCATLRSVHLLCNVHTLLTFCVANIIIVIRFNKSTFVDNIWLRINVHINLAIKLCIVVVSSNNSVLLLLHIGLWWNKKHCVSSERCITCELQVKWCVRCIHLQLGLNCWVIILIITITIIITIIITIRTTLRSGHSGIQRCIMAM